MFGGGPSRVRQGPSSPDMQPVSLVRVVQHGHAVAQFLADGGVHGLVVRTGEADGVALADAGGQGHGFGAAIHQHLGAGHGPLAGTAAAGDEADDLAGAQFLECALALGGKGKVRGTGADVLGLHAADDADLLHGSLLGLLIGPGLSPRGLRG